MCIANKDELASNGGSKKDRDARKIALEVVKEILMEADPIPAVKRSVSLSLSTDALSVMGEVFDLSGFDRIFVLGGGKAGGGMAEAVEDVLGPRITKGLVNIPSGTKARQQIRWIELQEASHPIPDEEGMVGCNRMIEIAGGAGERDLVIVLISGGASALLPLPAQGLALKDLQELTAAMLGSGATIDELNAVRKHISRVKGGRLAQSAYPATVMSLIISDVVGDPLDVIASGPTVPDGSTYNNALKVLKRYGLLDRFPKVKEHLLKGSQGVFSETLKEGDPRLEKVHNFLISTNKLVLEKVVGRLSGKYDVSLISTELRGEAIDVGRGLGRRLMAEIRKKGSGSRPRVLLAGGETTVTVRGSGVGGRNQELVLSAMRELKDEGAVIASIGTDGIDGMTDAAGAIADGRSLERCLELDLDPGKELVNNNSNRIFTALGDLIFTGPTGTNINDVVVMVRV